MGANVSYTVMLFSVRYGKGGLLQELPLLSEEAADFVKHWSEIGVYASEEKRWLVKCPWLRPHHGSERIHTPATSE